MPAVVIALAILALLGYEYSQGKIQPSRWFAPTKRPQNFLPPAGQGSSADFRAPGVHVSVQGPAGPTGQRPNIPGTPSFNINIPITTGGSADGVDYGSYGDTSVGDGTTDASLLESKPSKHIDLMGGANDPGYDADTDGLGYAGEGDLP